VTQAIHYPAGSLRVFAVAGTQLPFPRLMMALDDWASRRGDAAVLAQTGRDHARYGHLSAVDFIDQRRFDACLAEADLVVAHAGMGTILSCAELGKPLVVMPRLASQAEHRNDHQLDTARRMADTRACATPRDQGTDAAAQELILALRGFIWDREAPALPLRTGWPRGAQA
jgi:UDP-N-acetylglucosamine transferase subunit ALG13